MSYAEQYAVPVDAELGSSFPRTNEFGELFFLRWGRIRFKVLWGASLNIKVILKLYREDGSRELFIVDTDPIEIQWNAHERVTRDFFLHPFPRDLGSIAQVDFCYIVHIDWTSIPSERDYVFMERDRFRENYPVKRSIPWQGTWQNTYRTWELDESLLQRDSDWINSNFDSLGLVPKFTKGLPYHPFHPKRYIHDRIDEIIYYKRMDPGRHQSIKVCVDCIDDTDFVNHLIHAHENQVQVECIVDWRKMTLTNSHNYARLKRSGIPLMGVFCTPRDFMIEVAPDMHNKFIIFGDQHCIVGSFNITFDRWGANWESGMTFQSQGLCRLLDNIFQSVRGGVIQRYGIDPMGRFNLLYTYGRHYILNGQYYRPQHAILSEIHRARHSIRLCLFLIGDLRGDHHESVVDELIGARHRGVDVQVLLNGHVARQGGSLGDERPFHDEVGRLLAPAVNRLRHAGVRVYLAYGVHDGRVPYSPIHTKYAVFDDYVVLDGSFNWYNTSVFSHDLMVLAAHHGIAQTYLQEFYESLDSLRIV